MGMSNPASPNCPQCGAALPAGAPGGLCPRCLMALNLKTETVFTDDTPAAQPPLPPDEIAPHFPQLEILECLGRGGMGVVYKARQKTLNRFVALKLLAPERVHDAKFAERFAREAQALAALNHPNIVTIHDFGQAGGFYFLLMEFVDGVNLRQLLRTRKFTPEEALAIVPPLCDALQFAHERGIVHRDIKPENLLLDKSGRVKVADFGIAKMLGNGNGDLPGTASAPDNATKTAMGTPGYSAPEQKSDPQRVDSRADIYSLGVVFYEMLTGELPGQRIEPPSRKVQIDVRLDQVVLRALEKTPELRFQQASEVKTCVETIAGSPPVSPAAPLAEADLNRQRLKVVIWGLVLTLACFLMGENVTPATYGHFIESFGFTLVLLSVVPLVLPGDRAKRTRTACLNLSLNGIFTATAALWCATHNPMLPEPWLIAIAAGCLGAIVYCLACLRRSLRHNSVPPPNKFGPRFLRWLTFEVPAAILILLILRTFILQPFRIPTDAAAPELPRGSQFMVWKLARNFAPGDLVAYHNANWDSVGRVTSRANDGLMVNRNGQGDVNIPYRDIIGKVFSVWWRASNNGVHSSTSVSFIGQASFPLGDFIDVNSCYRTHDQMVVKGRYHLVSQEQALLELNLATNHADISPVEASRQLNISKGWGEFSLTYNQPVPGLPQVAMYASGVPFAVVYFGDPAEVAAERNLDLRSRPGGSHRLEPPLPIAGPWTNWNTQPEIRGFYAVAATTNETVAAGIHGLVATRSAATGVWHTQTLAGGHDFRAVTYAHGQYIAVSEGGDLLTSPDGLSWTTRVPPVTPSNLDLFWDGERRAHPITHNLLAVFWDGHQYLVGGDQRAILASPDGITWTKRDSGSQISLSGFAYSGTRYVAVGNDGIIISDDALTWRKPANWVEVARVPFTACAWTGTEFIACGLGLGSLPTIYTSPDGVTWTLRESTITTSFRAAIALNGSIYLAGDNMVVQSTDGGTTWTNRFPATRGNQLFMGLATDGQFLIAAGFSPNIWVLPVPPIGLAAAETWSPSLAPGEKPDLTAIRNDIKTQMDATNYPAALQRQLWYFNHALENGESDAVRLSFGVMNWAELGQKDPASRQALVDLRDQDLQQFSAALNQAPAFDAQVLPGLTPGSKRSLFDLYREITSLNQTLNDNDGYNAMVKLMVTKNPAMARHLGYKTADDAFDVLEKQSTNATAQIDPGTGQAAFDAIRKQWEYLTKAEAHIADIQAQTQKHIDAYWAQQSNRPPGLRPLRQPPRAADNIFVDKTRLLIEILVTNGHSADATNILAQALALHNDPWLASALIDAHAKLQARVVVPGNP